MENTKNKIIFSAVIIVIVLSAIALFTVVLNDIPNNRIRMYLTLDETNKFGFNSNTDAIYFGTMPVNAINSVKNVTITNDFKTDKKVHLVVIGNLKSWVSFSENNFILKAKENRKVILTATIPKNAKTGNYTGELLIYLRKV